MRTQFLMAGAAALALVAGPAAAQVLGGQVTGGIGVQTQTPGAGAVRDTLGGIRDTGQDAVSGVRQTTGDAVRGAARAVDQVDPRVQGDVDASAQAGVHGQDASASADLQAGLMLHTRTGEMVGEVVDVTRNAAGQVTRIAVRTADGTVRSLPPAAVTVEGDVAVTQYSGVQIRDLPED